MFQKVWLLGTNWDEPLSSDVLNRWLTYRADLQDLDQIQMARWLGLSHNVISAEIHGFSDASLSAYAAVTYLRLTLADGTIHCKLIAPETNFRCRYSVAACLFG